MQPAQHPDKGPWIGDLAEGDYFVGFYIADEIELVSFRDTSRGYCLRFSLADRSAAIAARIWEDAQEIAAELDRSAIVKVEGQVEVYKGRSLVRVSRLREARQGEFAIADLLPSTERDSASWKSCSGIWTSATRITAVCSVTSAPAPLWSYRPYKQSRTSRRPWKPSCCT